MKLDKLTALAEAAGLKREVKEGRVVWCEYRDGRSARAWQGAGDDWWARALGMEILCASEAEALDCLVGMPATKARRRS